MPQHGTPRQDSSDEGATTMWDACSGEHGSALRLLSHIGEGDTALDLVNDVAEVERQRVPCDDEEAWEEQWTLMTTQLQRVEMEAASWHTATQVLLLRRRAMGLRAVDILYRSITQALLQRYYRLWRQVHGVAGPRQPRKQSPPPAPLHPHHTQGQRPLNVVGYVDGKGLWFMPVSEMAGVALGVSTTAVDVDGGAGKRVMLDPATPMSAQVHTQAPGVGAHRPAASLSSGDISFDDLSSLPFDVNNQHGDVLFPRRSLSSMQRAPTRMSPPTATIAALPQQPRAAHGDIRDRIAKQQSDSFVLCNLSTTVSPSNRGSRATLTTPPTDPICVAAVPAVSADAVHGNRAPSSPQPTAVSPPSPAATEDRATEETVTVNVATAAIVPHDVSSHAAVPPALQDLGTEDYDTEERLTISHSASPMLTKEALEELEQQLNRGSGDVRRTGHQLPWPCQHPDSNSPQPSGSMSFRCSSWSLSMHSSMAATFLGSSSHGRSVRGRDADRGRARDVAPQDKVVWEASPPEEPLEVEAAVALEGLALRAARTEAPAAAVAAAVLTAAIATALPAPALPSVPAICPPSAIAASPVTEPQPHETPVRGDERETAVLSPCVSSNSLLRDALHRQASSVGTPPLAPSGFKRSLLSPVNGDRPSAGALSLSSRHGGGGGGRRVSKFTPPLSPSGKERARKQARADSFLSSSLNDMSLEGLRLCGVGGAAPRKTQPPETPKASSVRSKGTSPAAYPVLGDSCRSDGALRLSCVLQGGHGAPMDVSIMGRSMQSTTASSMAAPPAVLSPSFRTIVQPAVHPGATVLPHTKYPSASGCGEYEYISDEDGYYTVPVLDPARREFQGTFKRERMRNPRHAVDLVDDVDLAYQHRHDSSQSTSSDPSAAAGGAVRKISMGPPPRSPVLFLSSWAGASPPMSGAAPPDDPKAASPVPAHVMVGAPAHSLPRPGNRSCGVGYAAVHSNHSHGHSCSTPKAADAATGRDGGGGVKTAEFRYMHDHDTQEAREAARKARKEKKSKKESRREKKQKRSARTVLSPLHEPDEASSTGTRSADVGGGGAPNMGMSLPPGMMAHRPHAPAPPPQPQPAGRVYARPHMQLAPPQHYMGGVPPPPGGVYYPTSERSSPRAGGDYITAFLAADGGGGAYVPAPPGHPFSAGDMIQYVPMPIDPTRMPQPPAGQPPGVYVPVGYPQLPAGGAAPRPVPAAWQQPPMNTQPPPVRPNDVYVHPFAAYPRPSPPTSAASQADLTAMSAGGLGLGGLALGIGAAHLPMTGTHPYPPSQPPSVARDRERERDHAAYSPAPTPAYPPQRAPLASVDNNTSAHSTPWDRIKALEAGWERELAILIKDADEQQIDTDQLLAQMQLDNSGALGAACG